MRIRHYITFDGGSGPVSLLSLEKDGHEVMIRVVHEARFGAVTDVDPQAARAAVTSSPDLGQATTIVPPELAGRLAREAVSRAGAMGCRALAARWTRDGDAVLFDTVEEAAAWDDGRPSDAGAITSRRRRVMMG